MPRYGGHEDFEKEAARLRSLSAGIDELNAKEAVLQDSLQATGAAEDATAEKTRLRARAQREAIEVGKRAERVEGVEAPAAVNRDTEAIERNRRARERASKERAAQAREARLQSIGTSRIVSGARDPAFSDAARLAGDPTQVTQYRIRQALEGVGSRRARDIQAALQAGFRPSEGGTQALGPVTRLQAALAGVERTGADLENATRTARNVARRQGVSDEEVQQAASAKEAARNTALAAKAELELARAAEAEAAAKRQAEIATRRAAAVAHADEVLGHRPGQLALPPAGGTSEAPPGRLATVRAGEGVALPAREYPIRYGGGSEAYDSVADRSRNAAARKEEADALSRRAASQSLWAEEVEAARVADELAAARRREETERVRRSKLTPEQRLHEDRHTEAAAFANQLEPKERAAYAAQSERVAQYTSRSAAALAQERRELSATGVAYNTVSQQMHRHGALTTEFIAAAARGETTLRELGNQSLATAGKFAGWTAAGAALYTALDAVRQLGTGAIQSADGVRQLQRVIPRADNDQTQQAFADLSRQFNVPIDVAADAVYRMGQRFHDVPTAVNAAKAALFSFKTGEVDVATSTENLLAIVNGFGLSSEELTQRYDQINQAQNTFGIRIADTEAGIAKAAGAIKNSGGDFDYLLALFIAISRATNRSGQEIGTGLARGVTQIRQAKNLGILREQGVDADPNNFQTTVQSALKAVANGADANIVASALLGNQYARLIAPVLRDQRVLKQAIAQTDPESSRGSAQKELDKVLSETGERVEKIGNTLQRLGAALARSGLAAPLGLALDLLNAILGTATEVVEVFDDLPHGLREGVALLAEMGVAIAVLRKFGGTDRLIGGPLGFLASPEKRLRQYAVAGQREAASLGITELETQVRNQNRARFKAYSAQAEAEAFDRANQGRLSLPRVNTPEGLVPHPERLAAESERTVLQNRVKLAVQEANEQQRLTEFAKENAIYQQQRLDALKRTPTSQIRAHLIETQQHLPASFDQPSTHGTVVYGPNGQPISTVTRDLRDPEGLHAPTQLTPADAALLGGGRPIDKIIGAKQFDPKLGPKLAETLNKGVDATLRTIHQTGQGIERMTRITGTVRPQPQNLGRALRVVDSSAKALTGAAGRAVGFAERAVFSLRGSGDQLRSLSSSLSLLDKAFLGLAGAEVIGNLIKNHYDSIGRQIDASQDISLYTEEGQQQLLDAAKQRISRQALKEDRGLHGQSQLKAELDKARGKYKTVEYRDPVSEARALADVYEHEAGDDTSAKANDLRRGAEALRLRAIQEEARRADRPIPLLPEGTVLSKIQKIGRDLNAGIITQRKAKELVQKETIEAATTADGTEDGNRKIQNALATALAGAKQKDRFAQFRKLTAQGITDQAKTISEQIDVFGASDRDIANLGFLYRRAAITFGRTNSNSDLEALKEARDAYFNAIKGVMDELNDNLSGFDVGEGDRRDIFRQQARTLKQQILVKARRNVSRNRRALEELKASRQENARAGDIAGPPTPDLKPGDPGYDPFRDSFTDDARRGNAAREIRRKAKAKISDLKNQGKTFGDELKAARKVYNDATRELRQAAYDDRQTGRGINLALAQSKVPADPLQQSVLAVRFATREMRDAARTWGRHSRQFRQALTAYNNAAFQRDEAIKDDAIQSAQLQGQINAARAGGSSLIAAQGQKQAAQVAGKFAKTKAERLQALLDSVEADNAIAEALRETADLQFDLRSSQTEDPVRQARIARQKAAYDLAHARNPEERLQAQAEFNRSVQGYRNARVEDGRDDINFQYEMGRISADVAAKQLEQLARTHGLNKQLRRDLLLQAHQLRDEADGDYDLNTDIVKLPTLTQVRRFVAGGRADALQAQAIAAVTNHNRITVHVHEDADVDKVFHVMEQAVGQGIRSAARTRRKV